MDSSRYALLLIGSGVLFVLTATLSYPLEPTLADSLGLTSVLPISFWIGFILLLTCSVFGLRDSKLSPAIVIGISLLAGIYLQGLWVFMESNARNIVPYTFGGIGISVLERHGVEPWAISSLSFYDAWPGTGIITAALLGVTGVSVNLIVKYFDVIWVGIVVLACWIIGKRFDLTMNKRLGLNLFILAAFWIGQNYYSAQMFGFLLLLFFLAVISAPHHIGSRETVVASLLFGAIVITHGLTAVLAIIIGVLMLIRKDGGYRLLQLLLACFVGWWVMMTPYIVSSGVNNLLEELTRGSTLSFLRSSAFAAPPSISRTVIQDVRLGFAAVFGSVLVYGALSVLLKRMRMTRDVYALFTWVIGALTLTLYNYGPEAEFRVYMFLILPVGLVLLLLPLNMRVVTIVLVALMIATIPANYGTDAIEHVYNTTLAGGQFFVDYSPPHGSITISDPRYVTWTNPNLTDAYTWSVPPQGNNGSASAWKNLLKSSQFVMFGENDVLYTQYTYGIDLFGQSSSTYRSNLVYDSVGYRIMTHVGR